MAAYNCWSTIKEHCRRSGCSTQPWCLPLCLWSLYPGIVSMARHACLKGYSIPWPARLALPGGLRLCCHATCQASSAMSRQEHAASALACLACAQGSSLILPTKVPCNKCAGRGAKAGCRRAGHPGCSSQHSPSPFPQAQASAYRCPGHIQACPVKLMHSLHLLCAALPDWPLSHMPALLPVLHLLCAASPLSGVVTQASAATAVMAVSHA